MDNSKNNILFITLSAALGGLLFGYDTAVISGAIGKTEYFHLTPIETGWAISSALVGCLIGACISDYLSNRFGRKTAMIISAVFFMLSSIGTAVPETFTLFVIFRIVGGVGLGIASMVVPMYIAEIAPPKRRGALVGNYQLAIVIGIVVVYFVNYFAYYLNMAGLAGRDILWDQNHKHNLQVRRSLERILRDHKGDRTGAEWTNFLTYAKQVFFSNGIHHHYSNDKHEPAFSRGYFEGLLKG